jgi:putative aldouronate transport system permease protein
MKQSLLENLFDVANHLFMLFVIFITFYPFWYVLINSVSDPDWVLVNRVNWWPKGFIISGYQSVFASGNIGRAYFNTILYTTSGTAVSMMISILAAYALRIPNFRAKRYYMLFFAFTMFFGGGLVPTFIVIRNLGMIDTIWAVILPPAFSVFTIIIYRTNFQGLPYSLFESAFLEGANHFRVVFSIVIPLSKAIIATLALFAAVRYWNAYMQPLIYLNDPKKQPLQILLRRILNASLEQFRNDSMVYAERDITESPGYYKVIQMATVIITIGPIILVYPFVQRYFVKGVLIGSIKGE